MLTETPTDRSPTWTPAVRNRVILVGVAVLGVGWLLLESGSALVPFVLAGVLAYLLTPLVDRLARVMPRALAIALVYVVVIGGLVAVGFFIIPAVAAQIRDLALHGPEYFAAFQVQLQAWQTQFTQLDLPPQVQQAIETAARNALTNLGGTLQGLAVSTLGTVRQVFAVLAGFVVIPFFLFYVLKDKDQGMAWLNNVIPQRVQADVWRMGRIANDILNDYIRGQLILGVVVGTATSLGLLLVGSRYWLLLGIIAGFTELIPILGPILGSIPGLAVAAFHPEGLGMVLKVLAVYLIVQQLENNLLVPKIQGDSVKLHPAIILLVLVIGSQVAGLVGLIVAVPLTAIARDLWIYCYERFVNRIPPAGAEDLVPSRQDEEAQGTEATA